MTIAEQRINAQLDFARWRREMEAKRADEKLAAQRVEEARRSANSAAILKTVR
jgi:hypothetical protein